MSKAKVPGANLAKSLPSPADAESEKYESRRHLDTIGDAFDIMNDPTKMKRVKKLAGRHKKAIKSLSDLKAARDSFGKPDADEDDM